MAEPLTLHSLDYVVIGAYLVFVLVVAGIIGLMDLVFRQIVDLIIGGLGGA